MRKLDRTFSGTGSVFSGQLLTFSAGLTSMSVFLFLIKFSWYGVVYS